MNSVVEFLITDKKYLVTDKKYLAGNKLLQSTLIKFAGSTHKKPLEESSEILKGLVLHPFQLRVLCSFFW